MSTTWSISDLAKEFDVTTRTIRFYEDKGLISPDRKGTTRVYSSRERTRLKLILKGKRIGFSLEEIQDILDMYRSGGRNLEQLQRLVRLIDRREAKLLQQKRDIDALLSDMKTVKANALENIQSIDVTEKAV